jgi:hypothetical protein
MVAQQDFLYQSKSLASLDHLHPQHHLVHYAKKQMKVLMNNNCEL